MGVPTMEAHNHMQETHFVSCFCRNSCSKEEL